MKLAAIMPAAACDLLESDYHFCFAELALRYPKYAAYYKEQAQHGTVIMDTMVFERKRVVPIQEWLTAVDLVQPTFAISPDVLANAEATKANYRFYSQFVGTKLMPVVQGKDFEEFVKCFEYFFDRSDWIALPVQVPERRRERFALLWQLQGTMAWSGLNIHLLGASSDELTFEQGARRNPFVRGMDTTKPIATALNHFTMPNGNPKASDRPEHFFELSREECLAAREDMQHNVDYMRGLICSV